MSFKKQINKVKFDLQLQSDLGNTDRAAMLQAKLDALNEQHFEALLENNTL